MDPQPPVPPFSFRDRFRRFLASAAFAHLGVILGVLAVIFALHLYAEHLGKNKAMEWLCQIDDTLYPDCAQLLNPDQKDSSQLKSPTAQGTDSSAPRNANTAATPSAQTDSANTAPSGDAGKGTGTPAGTNSSDAAKGGAGSSTQPATVTVEVLTSDIQTKLHDQEQEIQRLIKFHARIMAYFFQQYFMSISVVMFAGLLSAIALFFIAQNGWSNTNPYVKTVFVIAAAATAYYGLLPPVFQQEKNITDNKALFLEYLTLRREVQSYALTRSTVKGEAKSARDFINYINSELARLGNIAIGFDYTKINYKGAFDINKNIPPPPGNQNSSGSSPPSGNRPR